MNRWKQAQVLQTWLGKYHFNVNGKLVYNSKRKRTFPGLRTNTFQVRALISNSGVAGGAWCITVKAKGGKHTDDLP